MDDNHKPNTELNLTPVDDELNAEETQLDTDAAVLFSGLESRRNERVLAFNLIYATENFDYSVSLEDILDNIKEFFGLEEAAYEFACWLAQGTIEHRQELDVQIVPFLKGWKLNRLGCCTRLILRMSLWELQQRDTSVSIVINEAVELAKMFAEKDAYKFINAVLDEFAKKNNIT